MSLSLIRGKKEEHLARFYARGGTLSIFELYSTQLGRHMRGEGAQMEGNKPEYTGWFELQDLPAFQEVVKCEKLAFYIVSL